MSADLNDGISPADVDVFANGAVSAAFMYKLWEAERARRLLMLQAVRSNVKRCGDPSVVARFEQSWECLARCERDARPLFDKVLLDPNTGAWLMDFLLQSETSSLAGSKSLRFFPSIAAAMALLASQPLDLDVPLFDGELVLPTVGVLTGLGDTSEVHLQFDSRFSTLTVDGAPALAVDNQELISTPWAPCNWQPSWSLQCESSGLSMSIRLDDRHPFASSPHDRSVMDGRTFGEWRELFRDAWEILVTDHREYAVEVAAGMRSITPLPSKNLNRVKSSTSSDAFGGAEMALPGDATQLAVSLVHELQHSKLNALLFWVDLQHETDPTQYRVPWRDDPRPLCGVLHGVYAFTGIVDFWRAQATKASGGDQLFAEFEFGYWKTALLDVIDQVQKSRALSTYGRRLVDMIRRRIEGWAVPLSPPVSEAVERCYTHSRAMWLAFHSRPEDSSIASLVEAFHNGKPMNDDIHRTVVFDPNAWRIDARAVLERIRLVDPMRYETLVKDPVLALESVEGLTPIDICDLTDGVDAVATASRGAASDPRAAVALGASLASPVRDVIYEYPDVLRRLLNEPALEGISASDIATWMATGVN